MISVLIIASNIVKAGAIIMLTWLFRNSWAFPARSPSLPVWKLKQPWRMLSLLRLHSTVKENDAEEFGTLTARIVPKDLVEYERLKPTNHRLKDVGRWRRRIVRPDRDGTETKMAKSMEVKEVDKDMIAILEVHVKVKLFTEETKSYQPHDIYLQMHRDATEMARRTLRRMELSSRRKIDGIRLGKRKAVLQHQSSSTGELDSVNIQVCEQCHEKNEDRRGYMTYPIDKDLSSGKLWRSLRKYSGGFLRLEDLGDQLPRVTLKLDPCPPTILRVETFEDFMADVFVGVPLVVEAKVLHAERAILVWFVNNKQVCYDSNCYTPTKEDMGKQISVLISPLRPGVMSGYEEVYQFERMVEKRPRLPILEQREAWINRDSDDQLRVMSYNLLADLYTSRELDQRIMYSHCDIEFLLRTRRMPLLLYEILMHHPDIVCLQEVDAPIFNRLLLPAMRAHGYSGFYSNKSSRQLEGCATFWSSTCFEEEADAEAFALRDLFAGTLSSESHGSWDSMGDIQSLLEQKPELRCVVQEHVGQILQVVSLRVKNPQGKAERLVVGNTHLFYHPLADHVRAMQAYIVCKQIDNFRRGHESPPSPAPLILCGDLNSDPLSGAVTLLLNRTVESDHYETWKHLDQYSWEQGEDIFLAEHGYIGNVEGGEPAYKDEHFCDARGETQSEEELRRLETSAPRICLPVSFPNLVSGYTETPKFTNYAVDFAETLDYILVSAPSQGEPYGFEVASSAPLPDDTEMSDYVAMPNEDFPSDHFSVACDLEWKRHESSD